MAMFKLSNVTSLESYRLGIIVYARYAFPLWYLGLLQTSSYFKLLYSTVLVCILVYIL